MFVLVLIETIRRLVKVDRKEALGQEYTFVDCCNKPAREEDNMANEIVVGERLGLKLRPLSLFQHH